MRWLKVDIMPYENSTKPMSVLRFDTKEEPSRNIIIRILVILIIIISLAVISTFQLPPKVTAQTPSEGAMVLVDDVIQDLKANDMKKAQVHLGILDQQLPTFVNSSSIQSIKVLLNDVNSALKNNDVNNALIHLNLVKQQLTPNGGSTTIPSLSVKESAPPVASSQITNVQTNHPPKANDDLIVVINNSTKMVQLSGEDEDGNPITFFIKSNTTHGQLEDLDSKNGVVIYNPDSGYTGKDTFTYQVTDNHNATSNIAKVSLMVYAPTSLSSAPSEELSFPQPSTSGTETTTPGVTTENPSSSGTDYAGICAKLQPVLIPSCSSLVNSDGSLTADGTHAMHCTRNGILLGGGAVALTHLPLFLILKGLTMLAAPTGCDGIVNMKAFDQLGDIGSLSSLTNLLP